MTWIRWETTARDHELVGALSEALAVRRAEALGLWNAVCSGFGEYRRDGLADAISDTTLESWALWEGKRGRFAAAFRELCVERREDQRDGLGVVRGWWRQDALLREQERSRQRPGQGTRKATEDSSEGHDGATERPRKVPAVPSRGNGDGDDNGTTLPLPLPGAVEAGVQELEALLCRDDHRARLRALIHRSPNPIAFLGSVRAVLTGLHPLIPHPTPMQVGQAIADLDTNGKPPEAAIFRAYCERAAKGRPPRKDDPPRVTTAKAIRRAG